MLLSREDGGAGSTGDQMVEHFRADFVHQRTCIEVGRSLFHAMILSVLLPFSTLAQANVEEISNLYSDRESTRKN